VARRSELELEAEAVLLPGLYCIEVNQLHGLSSSLRGPWTDIAEGTYQLLRQERLHTRRLASALRFARLCALLRRLPPVGSAGGTILAWRLSADELAKRRAKWKAPKPAYTRGVLAKYARTVTNASLGAVTDL
jgi:hypothetical protein